jgi:acylphosphatase
VDEEKNSEARIARRGILSGRVQGVGFRYFVSRRAAEDGITGWVRNLPGGEVETHIEGTPEQIESFQAIVEKGPPFSRVLESRWREVPCENGRHFEITY